MKHPALGLGDLSLGGLSALNVIRRYSMCWLLVIGGVLNGCGYLTYTPKALNPETSAQQFIQQDLLDGAFLDYMKSLGHDKHPIPPTYWSLTELTYATFYFNRQLDIARSQLALQHAGKVTAAQRLNPSINTNLERRNIPESGNSPWHYGITLNIPYQTAGKRQARIDQATHLSEAAKLDIAQTAWMLRNQLHATWVEYQAAVMLQHYLEQEASLRNEIVSMLEKRYEVGLASNIELSQTRLTAQRTSQQLESQALRITSLKAQIARDVGIPYEQLEKIQLQPFKTYAGTIETPDSRSLQRAAMLNRLDLRAALARYEAAEARLRFEIARQYPDIVLSPGYRFEEGSSLWSIGFSSLLSLINRNEGGIAEAEAARELEAARFRSLQAQILGELALRKATLLESHVTENRAKEQWHAQQSRLSALQTQYDRGAIDRLELTQAKLELVASELYYEQARFNRLRSEQGLEAVIQTPVHDSELLDAFQIPAITHDLVQPIGASHEE